MGGLGGSPLAGLLAVGDGLFQGEYLAKPLKAKYAFPQYRRSWVFMEIIFHALSEAPSTLPRGMNKSPRLYCMAWLNTNMLLERDLSQILAALGGVVDCQGPNMAHIWVDRPRDNAGE